MFSASWLMGVSTTEVTLSVEVCLVNRVLRRFLAGGAMYGDSGGAYSAAPETEPLPREDEEPELTVGKWWTEASLERAVFLALGVEGRPKSDE